MDLPSLAPRLAALAEADPEREVCGFVVAGSGGGQAVFPVRNVAEATREGYEIDPAPHLALARRLRAEGGRIVAVYHSHVDGPARLSATDLEAALDDGLPVLPGVDQVVIGMKSGKVVEVRVFRFSGAGFEPLAAWTAPTARRVGPAAP
ncbi:MAG: M67 family metallopeptidase [Deltaproteobacteria bacterium]